MNPIKKSKLSHPIILVKILDDGTLLLVDTQTTIMYLNKDTLAVINGFKASILHLRYKAKVVAFSSDGEYFATLSSDCKESRLFNAKTKKAIGKVNRHHGVVSCVGIDPKNNYMFSCGDDGKTFAIDVISGKLAFTLPLHLDAINDIAFSDSGQMLATTGYDKRISLFYLSTMSPGHKLIAHSSPVVKLQFLSNNRLFSVDKESNGIIWDLKSAKVIMRLEGIHDDVLHVTKSSDDQFLFLGTVLGYILVYELEKYKLLSNKYIKLTSSITSLEFDGINNHLIVATEDKELFFYDIYEGEEKLKELMLKQQYEMIHKSVAKNPLLEYTKVCQKVSVLWDTTVNKAKEALESNDKKTAIELFKSFKNIPKKNIIMQKIVQEFSEFNKFSMLAKQGKIPLAYALANAHPLYKESKLYKALESNWKKDFILAQEYYLDPKGMEKAKEILIPYRGISEKTKLIQELFLQGDVYRRLKISIGQKDFVGAFELIRLHPFLKEFPEYMALMNYADTLYIKSQKFLEENDTHSAIKILRVLMDFNDFEEVAKGLIEEVEAKQKFFNAVRDEDTVLAYNILATSEDLQCSDEGVFLQKQWNNDIAKANAYAVEGDSLGIKKVLSSYMSISSKYMSLATVFGWAYMIQLEQAVREKKDQHIIENGIKNYILCFGLQDQIESFYNIFKKYYPQSKMTLEVQTKGSLKMWRPSMIVESILD